MVSVLIGVFVIIVIEDCLRILPNENRKISERVPWLLLAPPAASFLHPLLGMALQMALNPVIFGGLLLSFRSYFNVKQKKVGMGLAWTLAIALCVWPMALFSMSFAAFFWLQGHPGVPTPDWIELLSAETFLLAVYLALYALNLIALHQFKQAANELVKADEKELRKRPRKTDGIDSYKADGP